MKKQREQGFTLIELTMSLLFIAFIILFLTSTMLSIMATYNKGIWLNQINSAGRQINTDISDQARFSVRDVKILMDKQRMCVGGVAYLWNTANSRANWFQGENSANTKLRLARVLGDTYNYCDGSADKIPDLSNPNVNVLLGAGVVIQRFEASEDKATGLLRVHTVFSTEGDDQPIPINISTGQIDEQNGRWQCGQKIGNKFEVGKNQFCAFAEFDIIVYRRLEK